MFFVSFGEGGTPAQRPLDVDLDLDLELYT